MSQRVDILFPVGRLVQGDLYEANDKDAEGKPLVVKNGPNAGQPRVEYFIGVAIPKDGRPWWETEWGKQIYQVGAQAFPTAANLPTFSWKVMDGDDATVRVDKLGKPQKANNTKPGWPGCWVLRFASGFAPKVLTADGSREITEVGAVKCGYFVQVFGNAAGNGSNSNPGVRLNPNGVALAAYGEEIAQGRDMSQVGFGQGTVLPVGASATPIGGMATPPAGGAPTMPGAVPSTPGAVPGAVPGGVPSTPTTVTPNTSYMAGPGGNPAMPGGVPPTPAAPVATPAAPAARVMTPKAAGATYESFRANGWSDEQLVQHGYMTA